MSQLDAYKGFVRFNRHHLVLGDILKTPFAAEYRKMHTLLRHEGWSVVCIQDRKRPGFNGYVFEEPKPVDAPAEKPYTNQMPSLANGQDLFTI